MLHHLSRRLRLLGALLLCLISVSLVLHGKAAAQTGGPGNPTLIGPLNGATGQFNPVVLRWNTAVNTLSYDVAYLDSTVSNTYSYSGSLSGTSFTLPNMPDGHLIYWEVFACDASSCSGQSPLWSFSMNAPAPAAPPLVAPNTVSGTGTTPTLSWNTPGGVIAGVTVYSATVADGDMQATMGSTAYTLALSVPVPSSFNLVYGRSYTWNVQACNAGACSGWGPTWASFSTAPPPSPPVLIAPNNVSGTGTTPTLSWNAASGAIAGITTYSANVTDGQTQTVMGNTSFSTALSVQVPAGWNLIYGHSFTWNATACNDWACSGFGTTWFSFSTAPAPAAPALVSPNNVTNIGTTPTLSWNTAGGAISGVTQYSASLWTGDTNALVGATPYTTSLSSAVPSGLGLVYGKSYTWNVTACNGWACSGFGPTWFSFSTAPAPQPPAQVSPTSSTMNVGITPSVVWSAPTNAVANVTLYTVGLWAASNGSYLGGTPTTTNLNATVPASLNLVAGLSYYWAVQACNGWACSPWSWVQWLFTTVPAPSAAQQTAPADQASNVGTAVTLTWNASTQNNNPAPGQTHYYVSVWDDTALQYVQVNGDMGINLSDQPSGLVSGHTYEWLVTTCNGIAEQPNCTPDSWQEYSTAKQVAQVKVHLF